MPTFANAQLQFVCIRTQMSTLFKLCYLNQSVTQQLTSIYRCELSFRADFD